MVKTTNVKTFWTIFFAALALLGIATAVIFATVPVGKQSDDARGNNSREYDKALYAVYDGMKNLNAGLGKASVSSGKQMQAAMLTKVVVCANAVNQSFADLPVEQSERLAACNKFVNQTQDYATYLIGKLASGKSLTDGDRAALSRLCAVSSNFGSFLTDFYNGGTLALAAGSLNDGFQQIDSQMFEYEKLIYDGPFSDSVTKSHVKCGKDIGAEAVEKSVAALFDGISYLGELNSDGKFYRYQTNQGTVTATCSGKIVELDGENPPVGEIPSSNDAIAAAEAFCKKAGYDVVGIWVSRSDGDVTYVNCATVTDGVIVYPELIKVAVGAGGTIVGLDAKAYLSNKKAARKITFGSVDEQAARNVLFNGLAVQNTAKCLVEKDGKTYAAWEFECDFGGSLYYVYVDSVSGNEVELFKVVEQTEGHTVL